MKFAAALLLGLAAPAFAEPLRETRAMPGLSAPGSITIDRWGVPHIRAASPRDAFYLQGWQVAHDRLWQIDLWRKRGLGRLAASFGPDFVAQDRASRLFLYRGDMAREWAEYPPEMQDWAQAFVAGINAFVAATETGAAKLPEEFAATGTRPERWQAEDIVRIRSNALTRNLTEEVERARALCTGDAALEPLRRELDPPVAVTIPQGLDPCTIPADVLTDYRLGTGSVRFDGKKLVAERSDPTREEGSNNWVIAPDRSATGRPMLANDPHREHSVPSLRYVVHLEAPGLHIAGAGEPALPGISFGHNDSIAWGLTIFATDQQDLVVVPPGRPTDMVEEIIEVKGGPPQRVTLVFAAEGPVIHRDDEGRFFALRATWDRPGAAAYLASSWAWRAQNWEEFLKARDHWGAPPLNLVFASTTGDIGWTAAGWVPRRRTGNGLLPVPDDFAHAATGFIQPALLPSIFNPPQGWFATANEMNLPPGYTQMIGHEWADRSRITRISEVLAAKPKLTLADMTALQTDITSPLARRYGELLLGIDSDFADQKAALALLKGWDGRMAADSAAAALFEIWTRVTLPPALVEAQVPQPARAAFGLPEAGSMIGWLEKMPMPARGRVLLASLGAAWRDAAGRLGPDAKAWRWGTLHTAGFVPALPIAGREAARNIGPVPLGGSSSTPMAASPGADFRLRSGASVRLVMDVGAWDNSLVINAPGQSGDAGSPHYRDLFPIWAKGGYVPFRWSRVAVDAEAERVVEARPAP